MLGRSLWTAFLGPAIALAGCSTPVDDPADMMDDSSPGIPGAGKPGTPTAGNSPVGGGGGSTSVPNPTGGTTPGNPVGMGGVNNNTGGVPGPTAGAGPAPDCTPVTPGPSPLRRLTTNEYNNTVRDLLQDMTSPGRAFPAQADSKHNLFGNDAHEQTPSPLLVEKYQVVAEEVASRATADAAALGRLHSCTQNLSAANEESCARSIVTALAPRALRRKATTEEIDELVTLYKTVRAHGSTVTFASGVAAVIEALLQSPEFLYRVETGAADPANPSVRKIAGREMANRLAYLFWQTMPDPDLLAAADAGMLDTREGVANQARAMLNDRRARATVAFFFDNLLPIPDLAGLSRDAALFPTFSSAVGVAMRQEVQRLLEYVVFENTTPVGAYAPGSWPAILTAPYTFVNQALYDFYGASTFAAGTQPVRGTQFQQVPLNTEQRLGLLTLGGITAGGTTSNHTNPVLRGTFILNKLMCMNIELPVGLAVSPPDPYTGKTARERFTAHSADGACKGCHSIIDPMGFAFENYDPIGLYRATEHFTDPMTGQVSDTPIDASGSVPGVAGTAKNAVELVQLLATSEAIGTCFSSHWMQFAYGRSLDATEDACNVHEVQTTFKTKGYDIRELLAALTQTDAFLYLKAE